VPERVDRVVGLPAVCPSCGGELCVERVARQWQEDLPAAQPTEICRYEVAIGAARCLTAGSSRAIPSRPRMRWARPLSSSAPRGRAGGLAQQGLGLSAGKVARLLGQLGLAVTTGG